MVFPTNSAPQWLKKHKIKQNIEEILGLLKELS